MLVFSPVSNLHIFVSAHFRIEYLFKLTYYPINILDKTPPGFWGIGGCTFATDIRPRWGRRLEGSKLRNGVLFCRMNLG